MIIEDIEKSALKPRSGDIILPCLRHFLVFCILNYYNLVMPSALSPNFYFNS
jgi:hypothetical protein